MSNSQYEIVPLDKNLLRDYLRSNLFDGHEGGSTTQSISGLMDDIVDAVGFYFADREADPTKHHPHLVRRMTEDELDDNTPYVLMSEIADGVFVGWADCAKCGKRVFRCECRGGPREIDVIKKWRKERVEDSLHAQYDVRPQDGFRQVSVPAATPDSVVQLVDEGLDAALAAVTTTTEESS